MSRWFRFYAEALDDPKVQKLDPSTFKHWVNLLCLAAKNDGVLPAQDDIAFALRIDDIACQSLLDRLLIAGLIDILKGGPNGSRIAPHGWSARQYKSDVSTDRVKRFRERSRNVSETPPDTDTETDTDIISSKEEKSSGDDPLSAKEVIEAWNDLAERKRLAKVVKLTPDRQRKLKARISQNTIDEWKTALEAIERSSFLCGDNDRGWKANFDFLLQLSSFTKLIEGVYDR